jgi:hypothetical protein
MNIYTPQFRSRTSLKLTNSSCLRFGDSAAIEIYNVDAAARKHLGLKVDGSGEQLSLLEE